MTDVVYHTIFPLIQTGSLAVRKGYLTRPDGFKLPGSHHGPAHELFHRGIERQERFPGQPLAALIKILLTFRYHNVSVFHGSPLI